MADVIIGSTQTAATKQDLISQIAQRELKAAAIFASYFTDVSNFAVKGSKSISFPKLTSFTVGERGSAATLDAQAITASVDILNLDVPAYLKWIVDPNDEVQSTLDWELETVSRAASAHGRYFDGKVRAVVLAEAAQCAAVGAISRDKVLEMRQYLKKNEANMDQVTLFVAASEMTNLLKIEEFSRADVYGSPVTQTGLLGRVFGIPVVETNQLEDGEYFMAERGAIAYGFQKSPAYGEQDELDFGVGCKKRAMDALYGLKGLQIGQGEAEAAESALMIRNADAGE
jgi:hypothetical protein